MPSNRAKREPRRPEAEPFLVGALTRPRTFLDRLVLALALAPPPSRRRSPFAPAALRRRRGRRVA